MKLSDLLPPCVERASDRCVRRDGLSFRPVLEALEDRLVPAPLVVTTNADAGTGSLRAEIALAEAAGGSQTITFASTLAGQTISLKSIDTNSLIDAGPAAFEIAPIGISVPALSLTIIGLTPGTTPGVTIARTTETAFRLFNVGVGNSLELDNLTLENGAAVGRNGGDGARGGGGAAGMGGAIFNRGTLSLFSCTLDNNNAFGGKGGNGSGLGNYGGGGGGGLSSSGATATNATGGNGGSPNGGTGGTGGNAAGAGLFGGGGGGGYGGGFLNNHGAFGGFGGGGGGGGGNVTSSGGGGGFGGGGGGGLVGEGGGPGSGGFGGGAGGSIYGGGGGGAALGGGIFNDQGSLSMTNCTLNQNGTYGGGGGGAIRFSASDGHGGGAFGGAVFSYGGVVNFINDTLAGNSTFGNSGAAAYGGELYLYQPSEGTQITALFNDILSNSAGNGTPNDLFINRALVIGSNNVILHTAVSNGGINSLTSTITTDPGLAPLAFNPGPTAAAPTMAITTSSSAHANGTTNSSVPPTDERGVQRAPNPIDYRCLPDRHRRPADAVSKHRAHADHVSDDFLSHRL